MSQSSSPLKRQHSEPQEGGDAKRAKVGISSHGTPSVDDILEGDIDSSLAAIEGGDSLLHIPSNLPSASVSAMDTPTLMSIELQADISVPASSESKEQQIQSQLTAAKQEPSPSQAQIKQEGSTASGATNNTSTANNDAANSTNAGSNSNTNNENSANTKPSGGDPDKLSDALVSAGVDLKAEEALLNSTILAKKAAEEDSIPKGPVIVDTPFLDPQQVNWFMGKVLSANGLKHSSQLDPSLIGLITYATEEWVKNIITGAIILSRHRRRSVKSKRRSELSVALRDLNMKAKSQEDKRQERKKKSGVNEGPEKEATEEIQHKATNATVAMMTGKKKKYDWMNSGGGSSKSPANDISTRFREAREEPGVVVRDLLNTLEKKRMGVEKTITKGYAKLKD